ncbi:helix-turn-helix domain-containing protein [uncultured Clostridium sp.]|uniref:helix-turn-helix domain-containing protein n=1 Tax=uncultured Clostridium sp. TaxID=59620 RepID=UPI0028EC3A83|nr:helix-turn-helix domain-containing protein [uncultured Clostridium sp.]
MIVINTFNISNNNIENIKKKVKKLQSTNDDFGVSNYTIPHDIKDPVRAIDGYARIFIEDYGAQVDNEGVILIENIRNICKDTLLLINKLLVIGVDSEWVYSEADEKQIINCLIKKEDYAIELFNNTAESIYSVLPNNRIKADIIMKKIYYNVIKALYEEYRWLNNYINIEFFETVDYVNKENINGFTEYYCEKISYLLTFLKKFYLEASDELINNISEYILSNSDSNLKLKIIAKKFYINNTYLSNTFATKTGIRFNDYITMVKMARAKYLFINTQLKTYEVGYKIGYRDINYFSKLFKKYYGKNPSEYKNAASRYDS